MTPLVVENGPPVTFLRRKMTGGRFLMGVVIRRYTCPKGPPGVSSNVIVHLHVIDRLSVRNPAKPTHKYCSN